tara:strand:- start:17632 stop:18864 length:1233 start_codon:yes stop_codon:yes gene_type:complete
MALLSVAKVFAKKAATSMVKSTAKKAGGAIVKAKPIKAKGGALTVVKKGGIKKKKVDRQVFMNDEKERKRRLELKAREDDEKLLEAGDDPPKKKKKKKVKVLGSLIDYIQLIIIGWFVDKLPKIIAWIENLIAKIRKIVDAIKKFFGGIADVIKNIGKAINETWNKIKSIKIPDIGDAIQSGFDKIKDAFGNIFNNLKDSAAKFLGLSKKDTKGKKLDEKTTVEEVADPEFKSVLKDMEQTMGEMNSTWDGALKEMEGANTGSEMADDILKSADKSGDKQTKVTPTEKKVTVTKNTIVKGDSTTITVDGKKYPRGSSGPMQTFGGKGGSTYSDDDINIKPINSSNIQSNKGIAPTNSITPDRKGEEIIVIDEGPSTPNVSASNSEGSTKIIVVEASVNSVLEKQLLTNLS